MVNLEHPALQGRSILGIGDLTAAEIEFILSQARERHFSGDWGEPRERLRGKLLFNAFFEPSTRTRFSFVAAANRLGLRVAGFDSQEGTSVQKGEPLKDTVRMVQGYGADLVVLRHPRSGAPRWAADTLEIPVINAGDGAHEHPTQTLLDLYSILASQDRLAADRLDWSGLTITCIGDLKYGRTVHSLVQALVKLGGVRLRLVAPPSLRLPHELLGDCKSGDGAGEYSEYETIEAALPGSDILYMTRIQRERMPDEAEYERVKRSLVLTAEHLRHASPNLRVLHPLPRNKENLELAFNVDETPHAYYYQQAGHGLLVRATLLALILGGIPTAPYQPPAARPAIPQWEPVPPGSTPKQRKYIFTIEEGTVIDHIPSGRSSLVRELLNIPERVPILTAEHLESRSLPGGRKDLLKIIGYWPSPSELAQLALVAPSSTVCIIREGRIREKGRVVLPDAIHGLIECPNPNCISRPEHHEGAVSRYRTLSRTPPVLECYYCHRRVRQEDLNFLREHA